MPANAVLDRAGRRRPLDPQDLRPYRGQRAVRTAAARTHRRSRAPGDPLDRNRDRPPRQRASNGSCRLRRARSSSSDRQSSQATAIWSAVQSCRIRSSLSRPRRSTSVPIDTLSTESRLTTEMRGIGSSVGSSGTSLGIPRIVVVQAPISAAAGGEWPRPGTVRRPADVRALKAHTTKPRLSPAVRSRSAGSRPERGKVSHSSFSPSGCAS